VDQIGSTLRQTAVNESAPTSAANSRDAATLVASAYTDLQHRNLDEEKTLLDKAKAINAEQVDPCPLDRLVDRPLTCDQSAVNWP
jgi:hypothetical protein